MPGRPEKDPPDEEGKPPAKEPRNGLEIFDEQMELLIQQNHPRVMSLTSPIPRDYPWQDFLKRHFAQPPFELTSEDYEIMVAGHKRSRRLKETRKPTTFHALFRFLEMFRANLMVLETNLATIEAKYNLVRKTTEETTGVRGLLRNMRWNQEMIEQKHEIIGKALAQKSGLEGIQKRLELILTAALPVTSKWQYMIEPLYYSTIDHINNNFRDDAFNLRLFYPVRAMEEKLKPNYSDAMNLIPELIEMVEITSAFLKKK